MPDPAPPHGCATGAPGLDPAAEERYRELYRAAGEAFRHQDALVWNTPLMALGILSGALLAAYQTELDVDGRVRALFLGTGAFLLAGPYMGIVKHVRFAAQAARDMAALEDRLGLPHLRRPFTGHLEAEGHRFLAPPAAGLARAWFEGWSATTVLRRVVAGGIVLLALSALWGLLAGVPPGFPPGPGTRSAWDLLASLR